jgi:hypothetical protein
MTKNDTGTICLKMTYYETGTICLLKYDTIWYWYSSS